MTLFEDQETQRQLKYKKEKWPDLPDGRHAGRPCAHILPEGHLDKNFYPAIYEALERYLADGDIAKSANIMNLKSSQACCFNFLFPLRQDLGLAGDVLAGALPNVEHVCAIEFEYTGPDGTTEWLGEPPNGGRGRNRTSIDAAIWWDCPDVGRRLTLVEWKYTEPTFGKCGGYMSPGNKQTDKCETLIADHIKPCLECYLASGKDSQTSRRRHYWDLLKASGISVSSFVSAGCPFQGPLYQLLRLYLVRAYCQQRMPDVDRVDVVVMGFEGNKGNILKIPGHLGNHAGNLLDVWNRALTDAPPLRWLSVEDWLPSLHGLTGEGANWRRYIQERYGV